MSIFERLRRERKEEAPLIHQDFKIRGDVYDRERDLRWRWNWVHIKLKILQKEKLIHASSNSLFLLMIPDYWMLVLLCARWEKISARVTKQNIMVLHIQPKKKLRR
jgi:hypothetical protein